MWYRINRYSHGKWWYWRLWQGDTLIARCTRRYPATTQGTAAMERDLRALFPQWVR